MAPPDGGDTKPWSFPTPENNTTLPSASPLSARLGVRQSNTVHRRRKREWDLGLFRKANKQRQTVSTSARSEKTNRPLISIKVELNQPNRTRNDNGSHSGNLTASDKEFLHKANSLVDVMENRLIKRVIKKVSKNLDTELIKVEFHSHSLGGSVDHSSTHPLTHPPTHPLTHSPTHPPTHSPTHRLTNSPTHPLTHSLTHSLHSPTHPLTHSPTHPPTHPLTHSLSLSLSHALTHSLTHSHTNPLTHTLAHPLTP